jgi:hypothetical protein
LIYKTLQREIVEKQRDEALGTVKVLAEKIEQLKLASFKINELRGMPIQKLKALQVSVFFFSKNIFNYLFTYFNFHYQ